MKSFSVILPTLNEEGHITQLINEIVDCFNKENILINQDTISTKYFGYNTYQADPEYFQKTMSESINPDYIIGPGDEIIIMLWGDTQLNKKLYVSREGYLYIKDVGQIFVNGLTLEKLEKKLFRIFKKAYSSLAPYNGNASTFFDDSTIFLILFITFCGLFVVCELS